MTVLAPGAPGVPRNELRDGVKVQRAEYWINRWQSLAVGLGGIVPNLRQRPWLALQVLPLLVSLAWHAVRLARRSDVTHAHWVYPSGIAGLIATKLVGIPLIVISHGGDLNLAARSRLLEALSRWVARSANTCVGVSAATVEAFMRLGVPRERVELVPEGVDLEPHQAPSVGATTMLKQFSTRAGLRVLYVGSLIPRKSVGTLIEAHRVLRNRGYRISCALIGTGPSEPGLRRLAEQLSEEVLFVGEQPPSSLAPWRSAAHVLVLPSLSEGRPYAVLEAMAAGLPVVVTAVPGTRELVQDEVTGLLFPPGNGMALADRLERLISEPDLGRRLGDRARARLSTEGWTVEASARHFVELSRSLISKFDEARQHK